MRDMISIDELYKLAIVEWGESAQIGVFIEEIGEVLQAISKYNRNPTMNRLENIIEELVDLEIMLEQMKVVFDVGEKFETMKITKLGNVAEMLGVRVKA